jgi:hypothetical protein
VPRCARATALLLLLQLAGGTAAPPLQGTYPYLLKSSEATLASDEDVNATVAMLVATKQTLVGMYVDECYYYDYLRPLLEATRGTEIRVFGTLRSHNGALYCPSVWNASRQDAYGQQVNWTTVSTTLATLSLEFPHLIGYTVDDFYCMMDDPFYPPSAQLPGTPPTLPVSAMQAARAASKAIAPNFRFMPTVYPDFLGVFAGKEGYTLGVQQGLPFDRQTSAALTLVPQRLAGDRGGGGEGGGSVSFWLASLFANTRDPQRRGKLAVRCILQLPHQANLTLLDIDLFTLASCVPNERGAQHHVSTCVPQYLLQVNASIPASVDAHGWSALTIELYARDELNGNVVASKVTTVFGIKFLLGGSGGSGSGSGSEPARISDKVRFIAVDSITAVTPPGSNTSVTNRGHVLAHDNAHYSIAPGCDGLLMPFPENLGMEFTERSYKTVMALVLELTQGQGKGEHDPHPFE